MLEEVYVDCPTTAYGYLVIDISPHANDQYRLRTHIFPDEHTTKYIFFERPSLLKMDNNPMQTKWVFEKHAKLDQPHKKHTKFILISRSV